MNKLTNVENAVTEHYQNKLAATYSRIDFASQNFLADLIDRALYRGVNYTRDAWSTLLFQQNRR